MGLCNSKPRPPPAPSFPAILNTPVLSLASQPFSSYRSHDAATSQHPAPDQPQAFYQAAAKVQLPWRSLALVGGTHLQQLQAIASIVASECSVLLSIAGLAHSGQSVSWLASAEPPGCNSRLLKLLPEALEHNITVQTAVSQRTMARAEFTPNNHELCPADWERQLELTGGLVSYVAVPVFTHNGVAAVLTLASSTVNHFSDPSWEPQLEMLAALLSRSFLDGQLTSYCSVLEDVMNCTSLTELVKVISRSVMRRQSSMLHHGAMQCLVAMIRGDAASALLFDDLWPNNTSGTEQAHKGTSRGSTASMDNPSRPSNTQGSFPWNATGALGVAGGVGYAAADATAARNPFTLVMSAASPLMGVVPATPHLMAMPQLSTPLPRQHQQQLEGPGRSSEDAKQTRVQSTLSFPHGPGTNNPVAPPPAAQGTNMPSTGSRISNVQGSLPASGMTAFDRLLSSNMESEAHGTRLPDLEKTVLGEAIKLHQTVWVSDCTALIQDRRNPASDVLLATGREVAGCMLVSVMFRGGTIPFMGLYLTFSSRYPPQVLQLLGSSMDELVAVLEPAVWAMLTTELEYEWLYLQQQVLHASVGGYLDPAANEDRVSLLGVSAAAAAAAAAAGHTRSSVLGADGRRSLIAAMTTHQRLHSSNSQEDLKGGASLHSTDSSFATKVLLPEVGSNSRHSATTAGADGRSSTSLRAPQVPRRPPSRKPSRSGTLAAMAGLVTLADISHSQSGIGAQDGDDAGTVGNLSEKTAGAETEATKEDEEDQIDLGAASANMSEAATQKGGLTTGTSSQHAALRTQRSRMSHLLATTQASPGSSQQGSAKKLASINDLLAHEGLMPLVHTVRGSLDVLSALPEHIGPRSIPMLGAPVLLQQQHEQHLLPRGPNPNSHSDTHSAPSVAGNMGCDGDSPTEVPVASGSMIGVLSAEENTARGSRRDSPGFARANDLQVDPPAPTSSHDPGSPMARAGPPIVVNRALSRAASAHNRRVSFQQHPHDSSSQQDTEEGLPGRGSVDRPPSESMERQPSAGRMSRTHSARSIEAAAAGPGTGEEGGPTIQTAPSGQSGRHSRPSPQSALHQAGGPEMPPKSALRKHVQLDLSATVEVVLPPDDPSSSSLSRGRIHPRARPSRSKSASVLDSGGSKSGSGRASGKGSNTDDETRDGVRTGSCSSPERSLLRPSRSAFPEGTLSRLGRQSASGMTGGLSGGGPPSNNSRIRRRVPSFKVTNAKEGPSSRRIGALVAGLQNKLQEAQRAETQARVNAARNGDELRHISISRKLGTGGFGACYLGMYQGSEVAVKIIHERNGNEVEVFRNAVELAVLSTLSHPNIVQVLNFFCDVGVSYAGEGAGEGELVTLHPPDVLAAYEATIANLPPTTSSPGTPEGPGVAGASPAGLAGSPAGAATPATGSVLGPGAAAAVAGGQGARPPSRLSMSSSSRLRRSLVIVMEYCDAGTLYDAISQGVFHDWGGPGTVPIPRWTAIYQTLLELALALRYLHSLALVHRDLKPQNVLLKTSAISDVRNFNCKLSDFGLVKIASQKAGGADVYESSPQPQSRQSSVLTTSRSVQEAAAEQVAATGHLGNAEQQHEKARARRYSGTVTHVAPEVFLTEGNVDPSVDIYAFGILMYELATARPVYPSLPSEAIIKRVTDGGMRPTFDDSVPAEYKELATRCWSEDPAARPTADELVQRLNAAVAAHRRGLNRVASRRTILAMTTFADCSTIMPSFAPPPGLAGFMPGPGMAVPAVGTAIPHAPAAQGMPGYAPASPAINAAAAAHAAGIPTGYVAPVAPAGVLPMAFTPAPGIGLIPIGPPAAGPSLVPVYGVQPSPGVQPQHQHVGRVIPGLLAPGQPALQRMIYPHPHQDPRAMGNTMPHLQQGQGQVGVLQHELQAQQQQAARAAQQSLLPPQQHAART